MGSVIKRVLLAVVVVVATVTAAYTLNLLDQIVHGTLYSYGLQFSYDWANPYWTLLRIIQILLTIAIVGAVVDIVFSFRAFLVERMPKVREVSTVRAVKKAPAPVYGADRSSSASLATPSLPSTRTASPPPPMPAPLLVPQPATTHEVSVAPAPSRVDPCAAELFMCAHCRKTFTQPLRMLDFQGDRPRIVNICPFCNETMSSVQRVGDTEQKEDGKSVFRKSNNHVPTTTAQ